MYGRAFSARPERAGTRGSAQMDLIRPAALFFLPLLGLIVLLHLYDRRRKTAIVPSLLTWSRVPRATPPLRLPRRSVLLALQLAALGALILGLAGPVPRSDSAGSPDTIFVLDVSASMAAREADGQTRFGRALAALRRRIRSLRPGQQAALILSAARPHLAAPLTSDKERLNAALEEAEVTDEPGTLSAGLALARGIASSCARQCRIEVFTDGAEPLDNRLAEGVELHRFGATDRNVAIVRFAALSADGADGPGAAAVVRIENLSHETAHGFLRLNAGKQALGRLGFSLPARGGHTATFGDIRADEPLHAVLEVDDALAADNEAFAPPPAANRVRALIVTNSPRLERTFRQIDERLDGFEFQIGSPAEAATKSDGKTPDVVILHRVAAPVPDGSGLLFIFPPQGAEPCRAEERPAAVLLTWDEGHPALRGLSLAPHRPFSPVRVPGAGTWASPLLEGSGADGDAPLAVAGWLGGRRVACLAFDPAHRDLLSADEAPLTVFLLRLIQWLAPEDRSLLITQTGSYVSMDGVRGKSSVVKGTEGAVPGKGASAVGAFVPSRVGRYVLRTNGSSRLILAHLLDGRESDIEPKPDLSVPGPDTETSVSSRPRHPGPSPWRDELVVAALLLIGIEWIAYQRWRQGRSDG